MLQESLILSFFIKTYYKLSNGLKQYLEGSVIASFFTRALAYCFQLVKESYIFSLVSRDGLFSRSWQHSLAARIIKAVYDIPAKFLHPLWLKIKDYCLSSLAVKIIIYFANTLHIWMGIFVLFLIASPHKAWSNSYSALAAAAFLFLYIIRMIVREKAKPVFLAINVFLFIFMIAIFLATVLSIAPKESLRLLIFYLTSFIFFTLIILSIESTEQLTQFLGLVLIGLTICGLYGTYQGIVGVPINESQIDISLHMGTRGRIWSTFDNPNNLAEVLVMFLPFYLALSLNSKNWSTKLFWLALSAPALLSLVFTQSRAAWGGFAVAIVVFVFFKNKKLLPLLIILSILAVPFLPTALVRRALSIFNFEDSSNKTRLEIYRTIWPVFKDYWITGLGLGNDIFRRTVQNYNLFSRMVPAHSHNLYLQIWLEAGVFAFLSFAGFLLGLFKRSIKAIIEHKNTNTGNILLAGICGMTGVCIAGLADHIWFNPRVMLLFWASAGIIITCLTLITKYTITTRDTTITKETYINK